MSEPITARLAREFAAVVDQLRRATVQVRTRSAGMGAGILWHAGDGRQGLVITNAHVVRGDQATIELSDGTVATARAVARDRKRDLAALEFEADRDLASAAAVCRESPPLEAGELVIALGHPGGVVGAATLGIVHAGSEREGRTPRWIQADVRLAPGFSGGPLADATGRLVGVNTMMHGGLALAVPAAAVEAWVRHAQVAP